MSDNAATPQRPAGVAAAAASPITPESKAANGAAAADGGLTDSSEDNEAALRSMIQEIAAGHTQLTRAVIGSGAQFDVNPLPLTAEQKATNGWTKEDLALNEQFQKDATAALKAVSTFKGGLAKGAPPAGAKESSQVAAARREALEQKPLKAFWEGYVEAADANDDEAATFVKEYTEVSALLGDIAARSSLAASHAAAVAAAAAPAPSSPASVNLDNGGGITVTQSMKSTATSVGHNSIDFSTKTAEEIVLEAPPFVPNSLYRMQDDAQRLRCGAFRLRPPEGTFRTTNALKAALEKTATKAIHRSVRPTATGGALAPAASALAKEEGGEGEGGAQSSPQPQPFATFMPVDGKSVAISSTTCVDLDDMLMIKLWRSKQEGMRFQLTMLAIGNSFTQHGLGLGVFAAPLCVGVRHLCHYFTVLWLAPIISNRPLSPPPPITAGVLELVRKRCGAEGALDVFLGVDGRRYVLPPKGQGLYLPLATAAGEGNIMSPRPAAANEATTSAGTAGVEPRTIATGGEGGLGLRAKHRRPEAVLRNKPSEDPDNQVNTGAGRQMAVLKKVIGLTRSTGYTINSSHCLDAVHGEFSHEGVCIRDLRAVFYNEASWAGVGRDLRRVLLMRAAAMGGLGALDMQVAIRLAKLKAEVRVLIYAQVVGRTLKALIESVVAAAPSDMQLSLINQLIVRPLLAVIERKARGEAAVGDDGKALPPATDAAAYGSEMGPHVKGLADAVNAAALFKYPVPQGASSDDANAAVAAAERTAIAAAFNVLAEPIPVLLAGLQLACRKLFLTLDLGDRKAITGMASRPVMIAAAVTSPPLILEKDAPISKRVSALEARFGMVDLVPSDQPVMRFLTLQRACFALGVLMKSAVGCSPDDKGLIQELVEEVLPTMIRDDESHDVTAIPYVTSVFPFAVAANVTFAALNAVNTVVVAISRLYPDYGAIPPQEKTVILSILRQLLIDMKRPDPSAARKKKKKRDKEKEKKERRRRLKVGGKTPGGTDILVEATPYASDLNLDGMANDEGAAHHTASERRRARLKVTLDGASPSASPTTAGLLTAGNVGRTQSTRSEASSWGGGGGSTGEDDSEVDEAHFGDEDAAGGDPDGGHPPGSAAAVAYREMRTLNALDPSRRGQGFKLTDAQRAALATQRLDAERAAAERIKTLLSQAKKLDESRPSYQARLAAKRAIALAGVQDLYHGFDDFDLGGGGGGAGSFVGGGDLDAFLANYTKNATNVAAADAAMNANNKVSTVAAEAADRDALAKEKLGIDIMSSSAAGAAGESASHASPIGISGGSFAFGAMQKSVNFGGALASQPSMSAAMAASVLGGLGGHKKSMVQKASELEEEDMAYLLDDEAGGGGEEGEGGSASAGGGGGDVKKDAGGTLTLEDCSKVFGISAKDLLKSNSFFVHSVTSPIPDTQTLTLPPLGKPEVIEAAAARLGLSAAAVLKSNPSFKPKDTIPATHALTVPLPLAANLAPAAVGGSKTKTKGSSKTAAAPADADSSASPTAKKEREKKADKAEKTQSPKKAAEIAAAQAEADRLEKEAKEKEAWERKAREAAEADAKERERLAKELQADVEREARETAERERMAKEKREREAAEEAALLARQKAEAEAARKKAAASPSPAPTPARSATPLAATALPTPNVQPLSTLLSPARDGSEGAVRPKSKSKRFAATADQQNEVSTSLPPPPQPADYSLSKAARKLNLDSKALLRANPDISGTRDPITRHRIITLPHQLVAMTVKEAAAQLGVSAQLLFDCNSRPLRLKTLASEVPEGAALVIPAGGEAYEEMFDAVEAYCAANAARLALNGREERDAAAAAALKARQLTSAPAAADGDLGGAAPSPKEKRDKKDRKEKKEKKDKQERSGLNLGLDGDEDASIAAHTAAAMERDIMGSPKKEKKEKKEKRDKGKDKEKEKEGDTDADKFERAMNNPIIRRLSTAYGYDPRDLLLANPHLHGATESTPIHGMISLPPRAEAESVAAAADRLRLTPRDLMLLNPRLADSDGDVPARFMLSVPANPPSSASSRSSSSSNLKPFGGGGGGGSGEARVSLSDGLKFDKRLRPDQTDGLGVNVAVDAGRRDSKGLDRASALLQRASLGRQNSMSLLGAHQHPSAIGGGVSGTFNSPIGNRQATLRSLNATPTLGLGGAAQSLSSPLHPQQSIISASLSKTPLRSPSSQFGQFGGLPSHRNSPSPTNGFSSPTGLGGHGRLTSLAAIK